MKRIVRACFTRPAGFVKACKDKCLAKLRVHVVLAVAEDLRQLARHVTAEREESQRHAQLHGERIIGHAQELQHQSEKRFDELIMVTESLIMEIVRMQWQSAQNLAEMTDHLHPTERTELRLADESLPVRRVA